MPYNHTHMYIAQITATDNKLTKRTLKTNDTVISFNSCFITHILPGDEKRDNNCILGLSSKSQIVDV